MRKFNKAVAALEFCLTAPLLITCFTMVSELSMFQSGRVRLAGGLMTASDRIRRIGVSVTPLQINELIQGFSQPRHGDILEIKIIGPTFSCQNESGRMTLAIGTFGSPIVCSNGSIASDYLIVSVTYTSVGILTGHHYVSQDSITMRMD